MDFKKLSDLSFLKNLTARSRLLLLIGAVLGIILLFYVLTIYFAGDSSTSNSQVASAPSSLENVPGTTDLNKQYQKVLVQSGQQMSQEAASTGGSAVQTFIAQQAPTAEGSNQCIICPEEQSNVKYSLDAWAREGKINDETAAALRQLADQNVSVNEYADYLNDLVKKGLITPEQARELLDKYNRQHAGNLLNESAKMMDQLIKSGQLPIDTANELLELQKKELRPDLYAQELQRLGKEGKFSAAIQQQLLGQYTQQKVDEVTAISIASLRRLSKNGELIPDVEAVLIDLEKRRVPIDDYQKKLNEFQKSGKLAPVVAKKILDEYRWQKAQVGPLSSVSSYLQNAEEEAMQELKDLLRDKQITEETAETIRSLIARNVPMQEFIAAIDTLVQQKKLSVEISKLKIADYKAVYGFRELSQQLSGLQANNASLDDYRRALAEAVQNGLISPEQAKALLNGYQALKSAPTQGGAVDPEVRRLQQSLQEASGDATQEQSNQFDAANQQLAQQAAQQSSEHISALAADMGQQAQQLITAWQTPPTIMHREGTPATARVGAGGVRAGQVGGFNATLGGGQPPNAALEQPVLVKSGTILFAVLDTEVNSDYPDMPIMATIVSGKFKGAKLLGRLALSKTASGQKDRVGLTFNLMNKDEWARSKTVSAFAIDPEDAKTALATSVDYHYLKRFGAVMATSFIQGYAQAIQMSGATTSTPSIVSPTQTSHPELNPKEKFAVAFGKIGENLSEITKKYVDIPPTVKIASGVGLGILFMSDVN